MSTLDEDMDEDFQNHVSQLRISKSRCEELARQEAGSDVSVGKAYLDIVEMDNLGDGESLILYLSNGTSAVMTGDQIGELRRRVISSGKASISLEEYNQLQAEWITRARLDDVISAQQKEIEELKAGLSRCIDGLIEGVGCDQVSVWLQELLGGSDG